MYMMLRFFDTEPRLLVTDAEPRFLFSEYKK